MPSRFPVEIGCEEYAIRPSILFFLSSSNLKREAIPLLLNTVVFSCKKNPSGTIHIRVEPTFLYNLAPDRSFFKTAAFILCLLKSYDIEHILSKRHLHMVPVIHDVNVDVIFNVPTAEKVQTKIRGVKELTDTGLFEVFVTKVQSYYVDGWEDGVSAETVLNSPGTFNLVPKAAMEIVNAAFLMDSGKTD